MSQTHINPKIFIQPAEINFDEYLDYANKENYNLEIASFAFADTLDKHWKKLLNKYKKSLVGFKGVISMHGAFQDLILHSRDKMIQNVAKKRIYHNLEIANSLNTKYIVFHSNFNPLINHDTYKKNWILKNAEFWSTAINKFNITIVLENIWETNHEILKELLEKVKSPFLKICFDTGHANIFSKIPLSKWFYELKDNIVYIHVNDNKGTEDNELVPGKGNINWKNFSDIIKRQKIEPNIIFEVGSLTNTIKSINYFKKNKIYPF